MKTIHALCFAALCAAAAVSCNKDIQEVIPSDGDNVPAQQKLLNPVTLTFTGVPKTKVVIDGIQASWEEGDRIKIISLDAEGNSKTVISEEVTLQNGGGQIHRYSRDLRRLLRGLARDSGSDSDQGR